MVSAFGSTPGGLPTVNHAHAETGDLVECMELPVASDHRFSVPANHRV